MSIVQPVSELCPSPTVTVAFSVLYLVAEKHLQTKFWRHCFQPFTKTSLSMFCKSRKIYFFSGILQPGSQQKGLLKHFHAENRKNEQNKIQTNANKLYLVRYSLFLTAVFRDEENVSLGLRTPCTGMGFQQGGCTAPRNETRDRTAAAYCRRSSLLVCGKSKIQSKKLHEMEL